MHWEVLAVLEAAWVVGAAAWIIWERRSPAATLAWIFGVALVPVLGLVIYHVFGPRRLERRRVRYAGLRRRLRASFDEIEGRPEIPSDIARQVKVGLRLGEAPLLSASRLDLFEDGASAFDSMVRAIEDARRWINLEVYIFEPDRTGTRVRDALAAKAREGVPVRLLVDGMGSPGAGAAFFRPLAEAGARVAVFNPPHLVRSRLVNFRTHRKILSCDGRVGFLGSMNVADYHVSGTPPWPVPWRDAHVRVEGTVVASLDRVFADNWAFATGDTAIPSPRQRIVGDDAVGEHVVQVLHSGPDRLEGPIHEFLFCAIAGADERVLVTTAYLVPDAVMLAALRMAAHRGVDVQVLVPARSDLRVVAAAMRSYFAELLAAGVKVHEYLPGMLHAKTLVVDRELAVIGSPNMDNRSFRHNFEVALAVYGPVFAGRLASRFEEDVRHARRLTLQGVESRPIPARFVEATARLFADLL